MVFERFATNKLSRRPLRHSRKTTETHSGPSGVCVCLKQYGYDKSENRGILGAELTFYSHSIFKGSMRMPHKA